MLRALDRHRDPRGWLVELFRSDELEEELRPLMAYLSMTRPGVARGPHEHRTQSDLFAFLGPSSFRVYLWDNRPGSVTYGRFCRLDMSPDEPHALVVPPGVVHAYKNLGPADGWVFNMPNRLFKGVHRSEPVDEIRHEDDPASPFRLED